MHLIIDKVIAGEFNIHYIPSNEQITDIMTNSLSFVHFNYLRAKLNVLQCPLSLKVAAKSADCGEYTKAKQNKLKKQNHVSISESAKIVKEIITSTDSSA